MVSVWTEYKKQLKKNAIGYVHKSLLHTKSLLKQKISTTNKKVKTATKKPKTNTKKWYVGGNLHNAKIVEWKSASQANKLATASDWLTATKWKGQLNTPNDIDRLKIKAKMLADAVDDVVYGLNNEIGTVTEIAAALVTLSNDLGPN